MLLGNDAVDQARQKIESLAKDINTWEIVSRVTEFDE
jgi:hypothetical protein